MYLCCNLIHFESYFCVLDIVKVVRQISITEMHWSMGNFSGLNLFAPTMKSFISVWLPRKERPDTPFFAPVTDITLLYYQQSGISDAEYKIKPKK
jgi:hypothetical protein